MNAARPTVRIVGRYALYGTIAAGGMATVHFGRLLGPVGFSRTVAIKRLHPQFATDPEFVSMFLDEARLAARIRHPNVVPTLDVVATSGELFLVMDYVPGESLSRLLRGARERGHRMPLPVTVAIMSGVLQGLHAAHEAKNERNEPLGIVHRDVSPQNVLVGSDGQARVLDFGVAKASGRVQTTREGQLKGKLAYMAPEQLRGEALSRQTDIYAAAVCLWECLTGERLFKGDNEGAVVTRVLEGPVVAPSQMRGTLPMDATSLQALERIDAVTLRGLERNCAKRFSTAREMATALEKTMPPATASEVSEWVEEIASSVLMMRAGQIAEIESSSSAIDRPSHLIAALDAPPEAPLDEPPSFVSSLVRNPSGTPPSLVSSTSHSSRSGRSFPPPGSGVSSISVSANALVAHGGQRSRRRNVALVVLGALAVVLVPIAVLVAVRGRDGILRRVGAAAAEGTELDVAPSAPPPGAATTASASADVAAPASASPAQASASTSSTTPAPTRVPVRRSVGAPQKPPSNDCNPPFYYDSEGRKHWKPNCI